MSDRVAELHGLGATQRPSGRLDCLIANGVSPNGLVLSADESVLFVAMTRDNAVWRVPLQGDGSVSKVGRFASFHGTSGPDGLAGPGRPGGRVPARTAAPGPAIAGRS